MGRHDDGEYTLPLYEVMPPVAAGGPVQSGVPFVQAYRGRVARRGRAAGRAILVRRLDADGRLSPHIEGFMRPGPDAPEGLGAWAPLIGGRRFHLYLTPAHAAAAYVAACEAILRSAEEKLASAREGLEGARALAARVAGEGR